VILSSKGGAEGVIIKRGQGMINVEAVGSTQNGGIPAVIARNSRAAEILTSKRIALPGNSGNIQAQEVVSRSPAVPPEDLPAGAKTPYEIRTEYLIEIGPQVIDVSVLNWDGDRRQASYQAIARAIAATIRSAAPSE